MKLTKTEWTFMVTKVKATSLNRQESYIAFLRGINNIGSKTIKMDELKKIFETSGLTNVTTVSASGNVIFSTTKTGKLIICIILNECMLCLIYIIYK